MAYEFTLPNLGENVDSADVSNILVSEGDTVTADQDVIEVETGKAAMPVPCPVAGTVAEIRISAGDSIAVGDVLMLIDTDGGDDGEDDAGDEQDESAAEADDDQDGEDEPAAEDDDGEADDDDEEEDGDGEDGEDEPAADDEEEDDEDEPRAKKSTGKKSTGKKSTGKKSSGKDRSDSGSDGSAEDGSAKQRETAGRAKSTRKAEPQDGAAGSSDRDGTRAVPASPSVRRFAREIGIDITEVIGTGVHGRITLDDVKVHSRQLNAGRRQGGGEAGSAAVPAARPLPDFSAFGSTESKPMSAVRKATAEHMAFCNQQIPQVTQHGVADVTAFEAQRDALQKRVDAAGGGKLTVTAVLVKVMAAALRRFPQFNVSIDVANQAIVEKDFVHIGIAVDTPRGLVVPVLRDADRKNLVQLTTDLAEISGKAREGRLGPADMQGGCITISNLGGIGGGHFTPIVNWPEVAILGVSRSQQVPVWNGEAFAPRSHMPLSLTYDHRVIDGADGARFLTWVADALADPMLVLLEG